MPQVNHITLPPEQLRRIPMLLQPLRILLPVIHPVMMSLSTRHPATRLPDPVIHVLGRSTSHSIGCCGGLGERVDIDHCARVGCWGERLGLLLWMADCGLSKERLGSTESGEAFYELVRCV